MPRRILILSANPKGTSQLRLDEEVREIQNGLQRAKGRDQLSLQQQWAVRPVDVRRTMLDVEPNIVHFCGHGTEEGIILEDETGQAKLVSAEALAGFFALFANTVECVVLNACYSETQARAIAQHIPYVIGMSKEVGDAAAIEFAVAFYDALGAGRSIEFAYKLACNAVQLAGMPDSLAPILHAKTASPPHAEISPNLETRLPTAKETRPEATAIQEGQRSPQEQGQQIETKHRPTRKAARKPGAQKEEIDVALSQLEKAESHADWGRVIELGEQILQVDGRQEAIRSRLRTAYILHSVLCREAGDTDQAIADATRAIELDPQMDDAYFQRGVSHEWAEDYEQAIADLNRALELDANQADYYFHRGGCYHNQSHYGQAITNFNHAIELDPNQAGYYRWRGLSQHEKQRYNQAIADFSRAIDLDPQQADYYFRRGESYTWQQKNDQALSDFDQAIQLDPNQAEYYSARSTTYGQAHYEQAIADITRAIELDPANSDYYTMRGLAHEEKGNERAAQRDYRRADELSQAKSKEQSS